MRTRYAPQDMNLILAELAGENDRAAITVGGSLVEHALELVLASRLRQPKNKTEASYLFSDSGILGTFWEKIWAAYFMGLIGPDVRRELDLIRTIKNEVAHNMNPVSFALPEIANRCRELKMFGDSITEPQNLRMRFLATVQLLAGALGLKSREDQLPEAKEALESLRRYLDA
jgi:hypothetical protein